MRHVSVAVGALTLVACITGAPSATTGAAAAAPAPTVPATPMAAPTPTTAAPPQSPQPLATPVRRFVLAPEATVNDPPLVRVLLQRASPLIRLPQPGRRYRVQASEGQAVVRGPLELGRVARPVWQVGAWREQSKAASVLNRLNASLAGRAQVWLEPGGSWFRVRVSGSGADLGTRLQNLGYTEAFVADRIVMVEARGSEGGKLSSAGEISLHPLDDWPVIVGSRRYRGDFRARVSGGSVLLINVLNLEWYLRGVVPAEMGPYVFPELEAIKAQTLAARTYAVAHLGDHDDEGYDLCATPACQAYHGVEVEHSMSNRAIAETRGLVAAFAGQPIDAMYTSTSGGHTEHAGLLFPDRAAPYLFGRPTRSDLGTLHVTGSDVDGDWLSPLQWRRWLARRALGLDPMGSLTVDIVLERLADRCGGVVLERADDSTPALAGAVLEAAGVTETSLLTRENGALWQLLAVADLYDVPLAPPSGTVTVVWLLEAAAAMLQVHELVEVESGVAVAISPGGVGLRPPRSEIAVPLVEPVPLFERWQDWRRSRSGLELEPGTTLQRTTIGDELLAVEVVTSGGGGEADRRSSWRGWRRERSWSEVARSLGVPDLERLEVLRRGVSGRVVELAAVGASGQRRQWSGFEIRRVLDLPETLFTLHVLEAPDGTKIVRFLGRGWGHGVGMCQNGAYGLARAGSDFIGILQTFYRGVEIVPMSSLATSNGASGGAPNP